MVKAGVDRLLKMEVAWKNQRIGLVTNDAAKTAHQAATRCALLQEGFNLVKIFSPEHGISAAGADGAPMKDLTDPLTELPIISLYGDKLAPRPSDLSDLDLLLFDIPDAGTRFYTYLWTLSYCLEICAKEKKKFIVLDRPNPLSGELSLAAGPFLDEISCSSFIGRWSIPIRHSCTLGELALYFNEVRKIGCPLEVIPCLHWKRSQFYPATQWPFTPPSPALQAFDNMLFYPGTCLIEATNLHEGRGTKEAFAMVAAPWLDTRLLQSHLSAYGVDGIDFVEKSFVSNSNRYTGQNCNALLFSACAPQQFDPVRFGFLLIKCIKDHFSSFEWSVYPTLVNPSGKEHLDRLVGVHDARAWFDLPLPAFEQLIAAQCIVSRSWPSMVSSFLLYEE